MGNKQNLKRHLLEGLVLSREQGNGKDNANYYVDLCNLRLGCKVYKAW